MAKVILQYYLNLEMLSITGYTQYTDEEDEMPPNVQTGLPSHTNYSQVQLNLNEVHLRLRRAEELHQYILAPGIPL
jgi:hypothetical protein